MYVTFPMISVLFNYIFIVTSFYFQFIAKSIRGNKKMYSFYLISSYKGSLSKKQSSLTLLQYVCKVWWPVVQTHFHFIYCFWMSIMSRLQIRTGMLFIMCAALWNTWFWLDNLPVPHRGLNSPSGLFVSNDHLIVRYPFHN